MSNTLKTTAAIKQLFKFEKGIGAYLPEAYKKFYIEWQIKEPAAVHFIPEEGKYKRDEVTGEVIPIQNIPLPLKFPKEHDEHLWGGEGVVQGFQKRDELARRVPHFWIPVLRRSVVYSEVLDKYISVVVTNRTINMIHSNYGFDHYLLKTPACDLKSLLALGLKRMILQEIANGCLTYSNNPPKQKEILNHYGQYLSSYTPEEIEWYGYSFDEACDKMKKILEEKDKANRIPLKHIYRTEMVEKLKVAQIEAANQKIESSSSTSWIQNINPFGKKQEA
ncbi:putative structural constituent of ribosome [Trypoxylus dichotomus]